MYCMRESWNYYLLFVTFHIVASSLPTKPKFGTCGDTYSRPVFKNKKSDEMVQYSVDTLQLTDTLDQNRTEGLHILK